MAAPPSGNYQILDLTVLTESGGVESETFYFGPSNPESIPAHLYIETGEYTYGALAIAKIAIRWKVKYPNSTLQFAFPDYTHMIVTSYYGTDYDHALHEGDPIWTGNVTNTIEYYINPVYDVRSNVYYLEYEAFPTKEGGPFSHVKMYIYNTDELNLFHNIVDITGSAVPDTLMFDGGKTVFDHIKKTSLELSVVRQDEAWFQDLIDGYDDQWSICVVRDGDMKHKVIGGWTGEGGIFSGTLLFYGKLTFQTYSEQYKIAAAIRLTFHDRLGVMDDEEFSQFGNVVPLSDILANCLKPCVCSSNMIAEFPYSSAEYPAVSGLEYLALPVSKYAGKKKSDVVKSICTSFGLRVDTDFTYKRTLLEYQNPELCGAMWIRHIASQRLNTITFRKYIYENGISGANSYDTYKFISSNDTTKTLPGRSISTLIFYPPIYPPSSGNHQILDLTVRTDTGSTESITFYLGQFSYGVPLDVFIQSGFNEENFVLDLNKIKTKWEQVYPLSTLVFTFPSNNVMAVESFYGSDFEHAIHEISPMWVGAMNLNIAYFQEGTQPTPYLDYTLKQINQDSITLINNAAEWEMDIKAKEIVVTWKPDDTGNIWKGGKPNDYDFIYETIDGKTVKSQRYTSSMETRGIDFDAELINYLKNGSYIKKSRRVSRPTTYQGALCAAIPVAIQETTFGNINSIIHVQGPVSAKAIVGQKLSFSCGVAAKDYNEGTIFADWFAVSPIGEVYKWLNATKKWEIFIPDNNDKWKPDYRFRKLVTNSWTTVEMPYDDAPRHPHEVGEIGEGNEYKLYVAISGFFDVAQDTETLYIRDVNFGTAGTTFPTEIVQTTNIAPKNRKSIKVDLDVNTFPGGDNDSLFYTDCLVNWPSGKICRLLTYEGLDQTLQAHLGDQYALQYQFDRWLFKCDMLGLIKLRDILSLVAESRLFIIASGAYDIKSSQFTGELIEFTTTENKDAWLWEDDGTILWEDGSRILL